MAKHLLPVTRDNSPMSDQHGAAFRSKRILFSSNAAWNLVNYRGGLIRHLLRMGHEVIALAPIDRHANTLSEWGCTFVPIEMEASGLSPRADSALLRNFTTIFKTYHPDIIFSYTIKNNIWGGIAAQRNGIPFIPNVSGLGAAFQGKAWLRHAVTLLYRFAFRRLPLVFFQNADDEALFVRLGIVPATRTARLPGSGVNLDHFKPTALPGGQDWVTFLLIARMLWEKGVGEFVAAAREVRQQYPETRFQLLGFVDVDNPTAISSEQMAAWHDEGHVSYLGTSDDVRDQIARADCIVLPTAYGEGTPRTLLEASAMGRPIITTTVSGCREVLRDGGNGFSCQPKDAKSLAEAMKRMIAVGTAARNGMAQQARHIVETEYSEQLVISAYTSALERYARQRHP